jgi:DNA polymerase-3 subunit epsilon
MSIKRYVICDIEATGLDSDSEIIEIALITWENERIVEIYETLINPLRRVSDFITNLTSISNRELKEAPKFYDVAEAIRLRLDGAVFVSHNTDFDLGFLKKKFLEMGQEFNQKSFCTLKVAQTEIPGLQNYNLDALCSFFGIKIKDRHRAIGDALATLELFKSLNELRLKIHPKILYLPQHEKLLKKLPQKAGLLTFLDGQGKLIYSEAAFNLEKRGRELLEVRPENRSRLVKTSHLEFEVTGSALIAEFRQLKLKPSYLHWAIVTERNSIGEFHFKISPLKKGLSGLWYFKNYFEAKKKLNLLLKELRTNKILYREGGKSKEEIFRHNQKVEQLSRESRFPNEHLVIVGEGTNMGERSVVLIRNNHVRGFGYTQATEEEIFQAPERFLTDHFSSQLSVDMAAMKYLRVLKNFRQKTESWRSLADLH